MPAVDRDLFRYTIAPPRPRYTLMRQCTLHREDTPRGTVTVTTTWIAAPYAEVGVVVPLLMNGFSSRVVRWRVVAVHGYEFRRCPPPPGVLN